MSYLLGGLAILGLFLALYIHGELKHRRMARALLRRRQNPTKSEFVELLAPACDRAVAEFLWNELAAYFKPHLTPHPDDDPFVDLPTDHEEIYDWLSAFCKKFGLDEKAYPNWKEGEPGTVRNIARWLAAGLPTEQAA